MLEPTLVAVLAGLAVAAARAAPRVAFLPAAPPAVGAAGRRDLRLDRHLLADVVYYRFFGDVLSTPALLAARQTGHVWGSIGSLFTPGLLVAASSTGRSRSALRASHVTRPDRCAAARVPLACRSGRGCVVCRHAAAAPPAGARRPPLDQMFRARSIVEQLGPFGYHAYDTWNYVRATWLRPRHDGAGRESGGLVRDRAPTARGGPTSAPRAGET